MCVRVVPLPCLPLCLSLRLWLPLSGPRPQGTPRASPRSVPRRPLASVAGGILHPPSPAGEGASPNYRSGGVASSPARLHPVAGAGTARSATPNPGRRRRGGVRERASGGGDCRRLIRGGGAGVAETQTASTPSNVPHTPLTTRLDCPLSPRRYQEDRKGSRWGEVCVTPRS